MTIVLDTNVLVYDTIENSLQHSIASEIINESENPIINSISIIEFGFVLPRYGINNDNVNIKLEELLHGDYFVVSWISESMLEKTSKFIVENKLSFRDLNDWIIAYDAFSRNAPLATFDKALSRKCKKIGIEIIDY